MKKKGLFFVGLVVVVLCGSCSSNKFCPAYAENSVEVEQVG